MDELDLLKQHWNKQEETLPKLTYNEIYQMIWKKSSSIVKWIFVISVLELLLSSLLSFFLADADYWEQMDELHLRNFAIGLYIFSYGITFYFVYRFYSNYRKIKVTDDAATLMKNILRTRKTVKTYIAFVLICTGLSAVVVACFTIMNHRMVAEARESAKYSFDTLDWVKFVVAGLIILGVFLGALWLFYKLIYGILLGRLKRNYKELRKLEI